MPTRAGLHRLRPLSCVGPLRPPLAWSPTCAARSPPRATHARLVADRAGRASARRRGRRGARRLLTALGRSKPRTIDCCRGHLRRIRVARPCAGVGRAGGGHRRVPRRRRPRPRPRPGLRLRHGPDSARRPHRPPSPPFGRTRARWASPSPWRVCASLRGSRWCRRSSTSSAADRGWRRRSAASIACSDRRRPTAPAGRLR